MTPDQVEYAENLKTDAQIALDELSFEYTKGKFPGLGVNWSDLHCTSVEFIQEFLGGERIEQRWRVNVEEVQPDCYFFQKLLEKKLEERGYTGIEIRLDW